MIRLERVSKRYPGGQVAVRELSIEFATGQLTMLVGPSGCGKTTTLKMINRLIEPTGGEVLVEGEPVSGPDPRRIFVFQENGVFPWLNARENVGFGLRKHNQVERPTDGCCARQKEQQA